TVRPAGGRLEIAVERGPLPRGAPVRLRSVCVPGGLGAHKWLDRRLLDALATAAPGELPLLVDLDGLVLEASRANVLVLEGDALATPPLDGRILPGTTRADVLARTGFDVREEPIGLGRLLGADAVVLTSALRGCEAVVACDGRALPRPSRSERLRLQSAPAALSLEPT
ncbi:MAG: aminotransferase class IV, partial [Actinomycetota bacterium]|nr:aminotransferase class IV [Actinomycetota bacterium]